MFVLTHVVSDDAKGADPRYKEATIRLQKRGRQDALGPIGQQHHADRGIGLL